MSRWLNSLNQVSNLLEKLDDRVENVVEERTIANDDDGVSDNHGAIIDGILAKRGLVGEANEEILDDRLGEIDIEGEAQSATISENNTENTGCMDLSPPVDVEIDTNDSEYARESYDKAAAVRTSAPQQDPAPADTGLHSATTNDEVDSEDAVKNRVSDIPQETAPVVSSHGTMPRPKKETGLATASKEAQKEVRVLRRHVVKLNDTLEQAESEIAALRAELARAGERMEKDRTRAKEQKEAAQKRFTEELNAQRAQQDQVLKDQQMRFEEQIATYKSKLSELENRRKQEGGDWNKEIEQAFEREQEMNNRVTLLEDEKTVLLNQIATLERQQVSLGSRVESLTQASESAMAREREAEDRLDATLSQHARQISQRQTREAELERTIQELNSALVSKAGQNGSSSSQFYESRQTNEASLKARIEVLENDLSTTNSQLGLERERSEVLHQQIKKISKVSTQEASSIQVEQMQNRRRIAEMALTISRLEGSLRDAQRESSNRAKSSSQMLGDEELAQQVKLLSEEVLRLRDKLGNTSGEQLALNNRLRAALDRASKAEEDLASATAGASTDAYDSMERAGVRGKGGIQRRRPGAQEGSTIRSAMRLGPGQGDRTEQLGKVVDAIDGFAVTTGKYLRRNPLARAGFILYLLLVHLWSFVLLFFHAHNFDIRRDDLGATGPGVSVGPQALIQQHNQIANREAADTVLNAGQGA